MPRRIKRDKSRVSILLAGDASTPIGASGMTGVIDNNPANTKEHRDFERLAYMHFKMFVIETYK